MILKVLELTIFNHKVNMSSVTMMGEKKRKRRERRKQRLYTHTHIFNKLMKYSRTVLVSGTGHVVEAGIYNCLRIDTD